MQLHFLSLLSSVELKKNSIQLDGLTGKFVINFVVCDLNKKLFKNAPPYMIISHLIKINYKSMTLLPKRL